MLGAHNSTKKGQVLTQDFMISIMIFSAVVVLIFHLINESYEKKSWSEENRIVVQDLMRRVDYMIRNPGIPMAWNSTTIRVLGFADEDHMINLTKFMMFKAMPYSRQKSLFGVGSYDFYIAIKNESNEIMRVNNEELYAGKLPDENAEFLIITKRFVYLVNESFKQVVIFEGGVWS